jgi:hypothetical protein
VIPRLSGAGRVLVGATMLESTDTSQSMSPAASAALVVSDLLPAVSGG